MTTLPPPRSLPTPQRAPQAPATGGAGLPTIDPIKLIQKYKWLLIATAIVGAVLGTAAHFVLLRVYPVWRAQTTFNVQAERAGLTQGAIAGFEKELEKFMATQVAIMQSERIITRVAESPRLAQVAPKFVERFLVNGTPDTREIARVLQRRVGAGVMGETTFMRLSVWDTDKDTATALTDLVSTVYMDDRSRLFESESTERVSRITRSINELTTRIDQLKAQRRRLLQDQNVDSLDANLNEASMRMRQIQAEILRIRGDKESARSMRTEMESQLASPAGIAYSDLIRNRVEEGPIMLRLREQVNMMEAELTSMRVRYGSNHRSAIELESRIDAMRQTIQTQRQQLLREAFDAQLDGLRTSIASSEATEADLQKRYEESSIRATELTQTLSQTKDIDNEIDLAQKSIQQFQNDLKTLDIQTGQGRDSRVTIVERATPPRSVSFPRLPVMLPLGIILAVGLVGGLVVLRELLDQRVKSAADVAMIPRTRLAGVIPHASEDPSAPQKMETIFRDQPRGVIAESYRQLRSVLAKRMAEGGLRSITVMSGMPSSGATTVAINLAHAFAAAEQRVLLIDANLRRPGVHKVLGLPESPGLAEVLAGAATLSDAARDTGTSGLHVLAAGAPTLRVYERLSSAGMTELLAAAAATYDVVLLDVAPAMVAGDAIALANRCDAAVLVVRALGEKRGLVARIRNELGESKAEFLGVIVNAVRSAAGGYLKGNILASHAYQNGSGKEP